MDLEIFLITTLSVFVEENDIEIIDDINANTRLIGASGFLDSLDLVSFIVDLEEALNEKFNLNIELANDSAMSRKTTPFANISSLADFIISNVK